MKLVHDWRCKTTQGRVNSFWLANFETAHIVLLDNAEIHVFCALPDSGESANAGEDLIASKEKSFYIHFQTDRRKLQAGYNQAGALQNSAITRI